MILLRATQLDTFMKFVKGERLHRNTEERHTEQTVRESILHFEGNRKTRLGTAFHGFMSYPAQYLRKGADGKFYYIYEFPDYGPDGKLQKYVSQKVSVMEPHLEIFRQTRELGAVEVREYRTYDIGDGIELTGEADGLLGMEVQEIKTTGQIDYFRYESSWQPKVYMELFGAELVRYHCFQVHEGNPFFRIAKYDTFTILRYPELAAELQWALGLFWDWVKDEPELLHFLTENHKQSHAERS